MFVEGKRHSGQMVVNCGKFECRVCGPYVRRRFMAQVIQGMEDTECSFLTLTIRKTKYPKSIDFINKAWIKWLKRIQRRLGKFEWVKIVEIQANGQPHLHAILKKPAEWFQNEAEKKWNPRKKKNEIWLKETDWKVKHWQEVVNDGKTKMVALNPVRENKTDQASAAAELSKYLSKAKSKERTTRNRWYSFSKGFRGIRAKLKTYAALHDQTHDRGRCTEKGQCGCQRLAIAFDTPDRIGSESGPREVFMNYELVAMMAKGG